VPLSSEMMHWVKRKIMWGSLAWFLWGMSFAVGNWLEIESWKPQKDSGVLWFGFGGIVILGTFMADCTEAILARIDEKLRPSVED
jgi:hypothetical protein